MECFVAPVAGRAFFATRRRRACSACNEARHRGKTRHRDLAAQYARGVARKHPPRSKGRRESRVLSSHPRPVCMGRKHTVVTTGGAGSSGFPCTMVLTVSFALSLVTGLSCHHRRRDASHHRQLDASVGASGPRDFAVRWPARTSARRQRPPYPAPYVRDDRETPLCVGGDAGINKAVSTRRRSEIFLELGLDSFARKLPVGQIGWPVRRSSEREAVADMSATKDRRLRAPISEYQLTRRRRVAHLEQVLNFRIT